MATSRALSHAALASFVILLPSAFSNVSSAALFKSCNKRGLLTDDVTTREIQTHPIGFGRNVSSRVRLGVLREQIKQQVVVVDIVYDGG